MMKGDQMSMEQLNTAEKEADKKKKPKARRTDPMQALKMEIAAELGLLEQVRVKGWHSLSSKEAGKIGGIMNQRKKKGEP
ncbi:small, acid-soluble spore protein, alpha/beta type [Desulfitobacterium sp. Sab5]|uniref:small, acid-soluble spore protein, alpha/beta type n=1 Tax=Desulfitobacterium TaxID=36853 RepID=UPI003CEB995B